MNRTPSPPSELDKLYPKLTLGFSILLVLPFASGYFLSFFSRSANLLLVPILQRDLAITAGDIGLMSGVYFMTFALFQVPLGVLLDRYNPAKINALLLPFACVGGLVFANATSLIELILGRALMGFGVSGCLMTSFRMFSLWMPVAQRPFYNGLIVAAGSIGNIMAFYPIELLLANGFSWREIYVGLAVVFGFLVALLWFMVPAKRPPKTSISLQEQKQHYGMILSHPRFIAITPYACTVMAGFLSMQSLWFGPLLYEGFALSRQESILLITVAAIGVILGNLWAGTLLKWLRKMKGDFLLLINLCSVLHFIFLVMVISFDFALSWQIWFLMGAFLCVYCGLLRLSWDIPTRLPSRSCDDARQWHSVCADFCISNYLRLCSGYRQDLYRHALCL